MRVKIGPYLNWIGPYQIADKLKVFGFSEYTCEKIGGKLDPILNGICEWVYKKRKRKMKIHIHNFDVWNMDDTLARIIVPMLKKFKEQGNSRPSNLSEKKWNDILDQMIWSFEQIIEGRDDAARDLSPEEYKKHNKRIDDGMKLFAKYYRHLWN